MFRLSVGQVLGAERVFGQHLSNLCTVGLQFVERFEVDIIRYGCVTSRLVAFLSGEFWRHRRRDG